MNLKVTLFSALRRVAHWIRHAPGLRHLNFIWDALRAPYRKLLESGAKDEGLLIKVGGFPMRLSPAFAHLSWEAIEVDSYRAFAAEAGANEVLYDIGAHIGTYTIIALQKMGPHGHVVAYEPHSRTRAFLEKHLLWNDGNGRVTIRNVCCGENAGSGTFFCRAGQTDGNNGLVPVEGFESTTVQIVTLDAEVAELKLAPTLIKIDVEGAEFEVLKGAENVLKQHQPKLVLSLHPQALSRLGHSPQTVLKWLEAHGYRHETIAEDHEIHVVARPLGAPCASPSR